MPARPLAPRPVPWRTIWAAIAAVLLTVVAIVLVQELAKVLTLLVVAAFFAVVLNPPVDYLDRRLPGRRALASFIVFLAGLALVGGMFVTFLTPIVNETQQFVENFPEYVAQAEEGRGPIGRLVQRYDLDERIRENSDQIEDFRNDLGGRALGIVRSVANTAFGVLTILVLTFLMLLEGPRILATGLNVLDEKRRERVRAVASDAAKAITGYVAGNLAISVVAGITSFVALSTIGPVVGDEAIPFAAVLALWVAFADLIPLVGATMGAVPAVFVAFLAGTPQGIAVLIFFIVYQQLENHVLQPTIMSKTVDLNPLAVLVSVLIGVELFGILGALLAIPAAGVIQVIVRDIYDEHRGRIKDEPSVGSTEVPLSAADDEPALEPVPDRAPADEADDEKEPA